MFFGGFTLQFQEANGRRFRLRRGGEGPPLLLLHGNPQTHAMWHRVAPVLAQRYDVVCPDLTGYGLSDKPAVSEDHAPYAKRAMAADMIALMRALGHERFQVVSHDRGARVAHRMALDHPAAVERLVTMDIIPTLEHFERADMAFGMGYWHWFFLAQRHPGPEAMIRADIVPWFDFHTSREPKPADFFAPEARADYLAALHAPGTIEAICEDYRAAATIDLDHDRASREEGRKVACPMLALWGAKGSLPKWYDPASIWRGYAAGPLATGAVGSGHYLAEEAPEEVLARLEGFLSR
ncbi:alpha/beta hydrolase [Roseomonas sp. PWR1]|uniref:Alpha/beta hydrolase n=1 Tax=Roseomonas nitratireducens TaxID=2820810 RepID=A0ABS4AYF1_9PROT|nr:alpha/beta hydrolase [Neoroseomonas nitratireducens]MBP0465838.1 alpha/beta hydrolase [Neoroseomonas nitratireducens]